MTNNNMSMYVTVIFQMDLSPMALNSPKERVARGNIQ